MVTKIISDGLDGASRAALEVALKLGIKHGGHTSPKNEDVIQKFQLKPTEGDDHLWATKLNVKNSSASLVFTFGKLNRVLSAKSPYKTIYYCEKLYKPYLHVNLREEELGYLKVRQFIREKQPKVLNIDGSRSSRAKDVEAVVDYILFNVLNKVAH